MVSHKSLSPEFLRSGIEHSIALEFLVRAFLETPEKPKAWSILRAELKAMEQLDVPYFATSSSSDALTIGLTSPIEQYFEAPGYNQVISQLHRLNEDDLGRQITIIRGTLYARVIRNPVNNESAEFPPLMFPSGDYSAIKPLSSEQLLSKAEEIALEILCLALCSLSANLFRQLMLILDKK